MTRVMPSTNDVATVGVEPLELPPTNRFASVWSRIERWLEAAVERANPILVKETRQALKSRQFIVTFLIVLLACWIVSFLGVSIIGPKIYYVAAGGVMLNIYYAILAFPLILIVPYSAFRSLVSEQELNTYDLLSITTLSSGKIISGKLGSAIVQMLVYLSAVSPCIAFSFLLRGVDLPTIAFILFWTVLASMGLTIVALLVGTSSRSRFFQIFASVGLVLGLAGLFLFAMMISSSILQFSTLPISDKDFWISNLAMLTFYVTTFALVHAAAAAVINFPSENRSTPLRRVMLVQQGCLLGWLSVPPLLYGVDELRFFVFVGSLVAGVYWYFVGTMLTGEWPHLSRRVQRSLPQSTLGRVVHSWLNPGPGTGYLFCVANLSVIVLIGLVLIPFSSGPGGLSADQVVYFLILGFSYVVFFLGAGRLLISLLRQHLYVSMPAAFLLQIVLLLLASGIPQFIVLMSSSRYSGYSFLLVSNPVVTLFTLIDDGAMAIDAPAVTLAVGAAAMVVFLLNLRSVAVELSLQRTALPQRVVEEEAELHPPPAALPTSPWDIPESSS